MRVPEKKIEVYTLDQGGKHETEIAFTALIDCSVLPPAGESPACMQLARIFADKVADGAQFTLTNAPEALLKEFRRSAERRGVKVSAGMARNQYGELIGLGHIELKQKEKSL